MKDHVKEIPDVFGPYLKKARAAICPIFGANDQGSELLGSGVLLNIDSHVFLLTASHVLDHRKNYDLLIPGKENIVSLHGNLHATRMPKSGNRNDDVNDIGFLRLDSNLAQNLDPSLELLNANDVDCFDKTVKGDMYTLIGYPIRKSRRIARHTMETEQFTISGDGTGGEIYLKFQRSIQHHLAIRFRNKKSISYHTLHRSMAPSPNGMSGGGIFAWSKALPDLKALAPPRLVGILTEYHRSANMFFGTRVNCHIDCIAKKYPNLPIYPSLPISHRRGS